MRKELVSRFYSELYGGGIFWILPLCVIKNDWIVEGADLVFNLDR